MTDLREELAALAHEQWSGWMEYLFSKCSPRADGGMAIPTWAVERWQRQRRTPYADLPEEEKESDRQEADRMLALVAPHGPVGEVERLIATLRDELPTLEPHDDDWGGCRFCIPFKSSKHQPDCPWLRLANALAAYDAVSPPPPPAARVPGPAPSAPPASAP